MRKLTSILLLLICSYTYGQKQITIILGSGSGGSSSGLANFYLKDSSLSSDRTVDLNGKVLKFSEGVSDLLFIDPVQFQSRLLANDGTSQTEIVSNAFTGDGNVKFNLSSSDGTNEVSILGNPIADTIGYTASEHIFSGKIVNANDSINTQYNIATWDGDTLKRAALPVVTPQGLQDVINVNNNIAGQNNDIQMGNSVYLSFINNIGHTQLFLWPNIEYHLGDDFGDYGMGYLNITQGSPPLTILSPGTGEMQLLATPSAGVPDSVLGVGSDQITHIYPFGGTILFTPANSTDATYPNGTMTASDTFLYFRKSNGTWVKAAWVVF